MPKGLLPASRNSKTAKPRGPDKRTLIREALMSQYPGEGEIGFWRAVAQQAADGDSTSASILANRLIAPLMADCEPVALPAPLTGSHSEQAAQIVDFVARGDISSSHGKHLMGLLSDAVKIASGSDMLRRLEAIETLLRGSVINDQ